MSDFIANSTHLGIGTFPVSQRATVVRWTPSASERPDCVSPASVRSAMRVSGDIANPPVAEECSNVIGRAQASGDKFLRQRDNLRRAEFKKGIPDPGANAEAVDCFEEGIAAPIARLVAPDESVANLVRLSVVEICLRVRHFRSPEVVGAFAPDCLLAGHATTSCAVGFRERLGSIDFGLVVPFVPVNGLWKFESLVHFCSPCLGKPSVAWRYSQCNNLYRNSLEISHA